MSLLKSSLNKITATTKEIINKINYELEIEDDIVVTENEDLLMLYEEGTKYFDEIGVNQNYDKALKCFYSAGKFALLDEYAMEKLVGNDEYDCDYNEELILDDLSKRIFNWYLDKAKKGCYKSQFVIAYFYGIGIGTKINEEEAFKWYLSAAKHGDAYAQYALGICYKYGFGVMDNEEQYVYWFSKAAENGDVRAQYLLGIENMLGILTNANDIDAFRWFLNAAKQGHKEAQFELGVCYYQGIGTEVDYKKSFKCYEKAMQQGSRTARLNLVHFYFNGLVVEKDIDKGMNLLLEAIRDGDTNAQRYLAKIVAAAVNKGDFNNPWYIF